MTPFVFNALPVRVTFGRGSISVLKSEIERMGCKRALFLCTPEQVQGLEPIAASVDSLAVGIFSRAAMHTPVNVTEEAVAAVNSCGADCIVAFGGGSAIGLGKAIALRTDLAQIAIPTTYAGSEMTPIIGETQAGKKTTQRTLRVLPEAAIYDVDFSLTMPLGMTVTSGMNAIAHAVEALYAQDRNPIITMMAEQAIVALGQSLPRIRESQNDVSSRSQALYGAWLAGMCLGSVGMALHHKLCHVLGGSCNLPHADTHSVVLPYALAFNAGHVSEADAAVARILNAPTGARGLISLAADLGCPRSLESIGMKETDINLVADLAVQNPYWNPAPVSRESIHALIADAFAGVMPRERYCG